MKLVKLAKPFVKKIKCRNNYYFGEDGCDALLEITDTDIEWYDYDLPASGGRGPRDIGTAFFVVCPKCNTRVFVADTNENMRNLVGESIQHRVMATKKESE